MGTSSEGTLNQGIYFHDPGAGKHNILSGWVDRDFAADIDSRKSVTGYLLSLNRVLWSKVSCLSSP